MEEAEQRRVQLRKCLKRLRRRPLLPAPHRWEASLEMAYRTTVNAVQLAVVLGGGPPAVGLLRKAPSVTAQ